MTDSNKSALGSGERHQDQRHDTLPPIAMIIFALSAGASLWMLWKDSQAAFRPAGSAAWTADYSYDTHFGLICMSLLLPLVVGIIVASTGWVKAMSIAIIVACLGATGITGSVYLDFAKQQGAYADMVPTYIRLQAAATRKRDEVEAMTGKAQEATQALAAGDSVRACILLTVATAWGAAGTRSDPQDNAGRLAAVVSTLTAADRERCADLARGELIPPRSQRLPG